MAEQSRGLYRLFGSQSFEDIERSLNFIFDQIANRLDQIEGLKGYPTFYKSVFDIITASGLTTGQVLRASSNTRAEMTALTVTDIEDAAPEIDSGLSANINIEKSLISLIDAENDYVVHQFPTQWLEYNCEVFGFYTKESCNVLYEDEETLSSNTLFNVYDENLEVVHQFPLQWMEYNSEVFGVYTNESFNNIYNSETKIDGDRLVDIYDQDREIIHEFPVEWFGYVSDVFRFLANGVDLPTFV